jgi:hypothetical protein
MDLFEKIDLFEKMATQLVGGDDTNEDAETIDNYNESEFSVKASVKARKDLLKTLLRG